MSIAMKAPGRYVQGVGERKKLGQSVKKLGSTFYVLCSPGGRRRFGEEIEQSLTEQEKTVVKSRKQRRHGHSLPWVRR